MRLCLLSRRWLLVAALLALSSSVLVRVASFTRAASVAQAVPPPITNPLVTGADVLTARVTQSGLVTIGATALAAAGWAIEQIPAANVHVWASGVEVPIAVVGGSGMTLQGATLRFIGHAHTSRFTRETVYWLSHDTTPGLRGPIALAPGDSLRWDDDTVYNSLYAGPTGDRWFAREVAVNHTVDATLNLPASVPAGSVLQLGVIGEERRTHALQVAANGVVLGTLNWSDGSVGPTERTQARVLALTLPVALPAGTVRFDLTLFSSGLPSDVVLIDSIELPSVRPAYSATPIVPPVAAVRPLDLRSGPVTGVAGADELIISPSVLSDTLAPLVAAKRQQGKAVAIVDVQDAYNAWSYGARDPEAIRSLIRTAAARWSPAPKAVLLVGAGTVRKQKEVEQGGTVDIPPYLIDADPEIGEIACDTCYTRLDADDPHADALPDIPIGRLPVRSLQEAATVVAKTVTALMAPPQGAWRHQALLLTDNDREADGTPDKVGGFVDSADAARAMLPVSWHATQVSYAPDRATAPPYYADGVAARCAFFRAWDGSTSDARCPAASTPADGAGAALMLYIGHASPWQWATTTLDGDPPYLYTLYDADRLANGERLPILLSMSCLTGSFANPDLITTDERLLVHAGGGTVASLSSSGLVVDAGQAALMRGLLPVLLQPGGTLGTAQLAGLRTLVAAGVGTSLTYSYNLLGDPDVTLPQTRNGTVYLPVVVR